MSIFRMLASCVAVVAAAGRIAFAAFELACDSADWLIGRAERAWNEFKWRALGALARTAFTRRELMLENRY